MGGGLKKISYIAFLGRYIIFFVYFLNQFKARVSIRKPAASVNVFFRKLKTEKL